MKNTNVKVMLNKAGEVTVTGIKSNGEASAVNYNVVETNAGDVKALIDIKESLEKQLKNEPKRIQAKLKSSLTMQVAQSNICGIYDGIHYIAENKAYDKLPLLQSKVEMLVGYFQEMGIWNEYHQTNAELDATKKLPRNENRPRRTVKEEKKETPAKAETAAAEQKPEPKKEEKAVKKEYKTTSTKGQMFTNIKKVGERAVQFEVANKGVCVVGFAKDRNAFMESFNATIKEVTRVDVVRRLSKYQGNDARQLVQIINGLKPVTMAAGTCSSCGCAVQRSVKEYSVRNYGAVLCRPCQNGAKKSPERSEGQNQPTSQESVKGAEHSEAPLVCACGQVRKPHFENCAKCFEADLEKSRENLESICACGNTKERAYESCEECRENQWSESDENQMSLEESETPVVDALDWLNHKDACACGNEKFTVTNMCDECAELSYQRQLEQAMLELDEEEELEGANEVSATEGDDVVALDMEELALGIISSGSQATVDDDADSIL